MEALCFDADRVDRHKEERLTANRLAAGTDNQRRVYIHTGPWDNTSPRD